ncbi:MAG: type II CAAX prenyl endopeptidase Rce1 family protein [bacterium]
MKKCNNCGEHLIDSHRFCPKCGNRTYTIKNTTQIEREVYNVFLIFFSQLTFIAFLLLYRNELDSPIIIDLVFAIIAVILSIRFYKVLKPSLAIQRFSIKKSLQYAGIQTIITSFTFLVSYTLTQIFDLNSSTIKSEYEHYSYPFIIAFISIAIMPAIIEELVFRGVLFGQLLKLIHEKSVIIVTGILFAIIHFNFIGFIWLIPAGIYLGWLRYKEHTIWYGSLCHFIHNGICVIVVYYN